MPGLKHTSIINMLAMHMLVYVCKSSAFSASKLMSQKNNLYTSLPRISTLKFDKAPKVAPFYKIRTIRHQETFSAVSSVSCLGGASLTGEIASITLQSLQVAPATFGLAECDSMIRLAVDTDSLDSGRALLGGMLAGASAGAAVDFALYPLDAIKTRLQTGSKWPPPRLLAGGGVGGPADALAAWLREFAGLYAGVAGSLVAHVPASAVFFAVYETSKVVDRAGEMDGYLDRGREGGRERGREGGREGGRERA
jgi:hypothetical protein